MLVGSVVHALVVESAEWVRVGEVRGSASRPFVSMMNFTPGERSLAAVGDAGLVL